uniref:Uncharacterized protein n=1 Tax=Setaria italica TaxID=4555 RepID=K4ALY0_SETIT
MSRQTNGIVFFYKMERRRIGCIHFYRSFHFCAYPSCWFSLCMAKRSLGMWKSSTSYVTKCLSIYKTSITNIPS